MKKDILIFSVPRSGATLVSNICKEIFGDENIGHIHSFNYVYDNILIPIRDFRDCFVSWIIRKERRKGNEIKKFSLFQTFYGIFWIKRYISILNRYQFENKREGIWFKYKRFKDNYDYIIDKLERVFKIEVSQEKRNEIKEKFDINRVKEISNNVEIGIFDKETKVSKFHIDDGKTGKWKNYIPKYLWGLTYLLLRRNLLDYGFGSGLNKGDKPYEGVKDE